MKVNRRSLLICTIGLTVVLFLLIGCSGPRRPLTSDVTPTSPVVARSADDEEGEGEPTIEEEDGADVMETAMAESARATEMAGGETADATATATLPPPTDTATPLPPTPTPLPTTPAPTATPVPATGGTVTHVVQPGENLFRIALKYGTTVEEIASANGIANPSLIKVGQTLTVPCPDGQVQPTQPATGSTYVVQPGDNLFRIALRHNMSHIQLAEYNDISNPSQIYVGQVLRIPPQ